MSSRRLLIGLMGIVIGCISAFSFAVIHFGWAQEVGGVAGELLALSARFVPGCLFGLAIAVIYFTNVEQKRSLRLVGAGAIIVVGAVCYQTAFYITFLTSLTVGSVLIFAPAGAAVGGFFATWVFVSILQMITNKYSRTRLKFSFYGGILGAILIDPIAFLLIDPAATQTDASILFSSCIFFIGWQTIMLLIISGPLLKKESKV